MNAYDPTELLALCDSILKRSQISGDDAYGLAQWLNEHPGACVHWPGFMLVGALQETWRDGHVNKGELHHLHRLLLKIDSDKRRLTRGAESDDGGLPEHRVPMCEYAYTDSMQSVLSFPDQVSHVFVSEAALRDRIDYLDWQPDAPLGVDTSRVEWCVEPKVDGVFVNLRYLYGTLICMATSGQYVTRHASSVAGIPLRIEWTRDLIEIRGDIYIAQQDFALINAERMRLGRKPFVSPQKVVNGALKLDDSGESATRRLRFMAFELGECAGDTPATQSGLLEWLRARGCPVPPHGVCMTGALEETIRSIGSQGWAFDTLGVTVKLNDREAQRQLGYESAGVDPTRYFRKWAMVYRPKPS